MRRTIQAILEKAGVEINGSQPWDLQLHDERLFRRMMCFGDIGFGDAYMDGWWDCEAIDELVYRIMNVVTIHERRPWMVAVPGYLMGKLRNLQSLARAFQVGEKHYDIGNDLYRAMLDERMVYSCAYWQAGAENLDQAQVDKLELVCRKVGLKPGMRVLDIGCGWGSFCRYAAENYGVEIVGLTVSKEQAELTREQLKDFPVEIRLQDYRSYRSEFDAVISIGMFEHVGRKNYATYMGMVKECLKPDGLFLLHTIGGNTTRVSGRTWLAKHIFPNGYIPSMQLISAAVEKRFVVEDMHNFGPDYAQTLMHWYRNFDLAWPRLKGCKPQYTDRFYRMWRFYLLSCAGVFRVRNLQAWQWVLSPKGLPETYKRPVLYSP
jgi:cyclopropane-fatty-acyl-phospholipid synthase